MKRTILIADDSALDRKILKKQLKDYEILEAAGGDEVLRILKEKYTVLSALILDIAMPGLDGFGVLKVLRKDSEYLDLPVILITADTSIDNRKKAIEFGANGFLSKPYDPFLLKKSLENVISIRENAALAHALSKDKLTGMVSHELFFEDCDRLIQAHEPGYYMMACIDIDNFKVINDQYGMETGDEVLKHVAKCISICYLELDGLACRFNADRFAVLYPARFSNAKVILDNHKQATTPSCLVYPIRIRVGRYLVQDLSIKANIMYERATVAEESLKGRYDVYIAEYDDSMRAHILKEQQIVNEMDTALREGQFVPFLQAQYNHASGALIGAEALARWRKGNTFISPAEFIPIFEKNGFVYEVDKNIWEQVCALLRKWIDEGRDPLPVSVNISRVDLYRADFFETICNLVSKYKIPVELLRLEVTESAFTDSPQHIIEMVNQLIEHGFTVEIDDFGSGYSSLNTLKDVPASILKLDMRFFSDTKNSVRSGNIIESVVRMAKWLGMAVIAEGVEKTVIADYLKSIGCYYIQGFLYSLPVPVEEYEKLLGNGPHERRLTRLKTVSSMDNNQFWNPQSMETLVFNSYVGGACIFEQHGDNLELLRVNNQYLHEIGNAISTKMDLTSLNPVHYLDKNNLLTLQSTIQKAVKTKEEGTCELVIRNMKQEIEYVRYTLRVIASTDERILLYCVVVNTTARHQTEQKLIRAEQHETQSTQRLETVLNHAGNGIAAVVKHSKNDEFIFANDKFFEIFGYTREAYYLKTKEDIFSIVDPADRLKVIRKVEQANNAAKEETLEFRVLRPDGKKVYVKACITMTVLYGIADPVQIVVVTDNTKEKEANEQLVFLNQLAHDLLEQPDDKRALEGILTRILSYFAGDRAYVVELDDQKQIAQNTYEVCAEHILSEKRNLQHVPYDHNIFWYDTLQNNDFVQIDDVAGMGEAERETRELLLK